jgi:hypothetical protein
MNKKKNTKNPLRKLNKTQKEIQEKMLTLILAGFFFPESEGVIGKFVYAIMVTILVVIISLQLKKLKDEE